MLDYADCVYRIINVTCGGGNPPTTVFSDTFEAANGWTTNASGTDTATTGAWERGDPAATTSGVALQLGTTTSGTNDLVTGASAGTSAGANDVDGGTTSIRSPLITLPTTGTLTLLFLLISLAVSPSTIVRRTGAGILTTVPGVREARGAARGVTFVVLSVPTIA